MKRFKLLILTVVIAGITASLLIHYRGRAALRESDVRLRNQRNELTELEAEQQRLLNLQRDSTNATGSINETTDELAKLQAQAAALRQRTNDLARERAAERRATAEQLIFSGDSNALQHTRDSGPQMEDSKAYDIRTLSWALGMYANEHAGEYPTTLEQLAPYLPEALWRISRGDRDKPANSRSPWSGTNDFELVFQGTRADLTNIPPRRVAVLRERQPWLTPDGKWARYYGLADGTAISVVSDDQFQTWEAIHIIPPR